MATVITNSVGSWKICRMDNISKITRETRPKTREEFETRATLLQLLRELENFIQLKVDFYQRYAEDKSNLS